MLSVSAGSAAPRHPLEGCQQSPGPYDASPSEAESLPGGAVAFFKTSPRHHDGGPSGEPPL